MNDAYKMLADLTKNSRASIDTALNFIHSLPITNVYTVEPDGSADIRFKARQIAQDLNIDDILSKKTRKATPSKTQRAKSGQSSRHTAQRAQSYKLAASNNGISQNTSDPSEMRLYAAAKVEANRLEKEVREQMIADRAKELIERQKVRLQEEARLLAEKKLEQATQLVAEQKELYRMEALEKCAAMMAHRKQIILATQLLARWKAHIKVLERNKAILVRRFDACFINLAFTAWKKQLAERRRAYDEERHRLRMETFKSRSKMAETNYVIILIKRTLLAMRMEAQRRQEQRRQEEARIVRERRLESFIQRIEISQSLRLSQPESTEVPPLEASKARQTLEHQVSSQSECIKIPGFDNTIKRVTFRNSEGHDAETTEAKPKPLGVSPGDPKPQSTTANVPIAKKLVRKTPTQYTDYAKKAAERKQERLRRLEEDRLAREEAERTKKQLVEELARQKARVRKEQLEAAALHHENLLIRISFFVILRLTKNLRMRRESINRKRLYNAFASWIEEMKKKAGKKIEKLNRAELIIARTMDKVEKQYRFIHGFLPLLYQARQKQYRADKFFTRTLTQRYFTRIRMLLQDKEAQDKLRGEKFRKVVLKTTILFSWRRVLRELQTDRRAEARQNELYKLMRAEISAQWEEMVERLILESFTPLYNRLEPIIRSFNEIIDVSSLDCLAETALYSITLLQDGINVQPPQAVTLAVDLPSQSECILVSTSPHDKQSPPLKDADEQLDFANISALIAAARQLTSQHGPARTMEPDFTYDFSSLQSYPAGASAYIAEQSMFCPITFSAGASNQ